MGYTSLEAYSTHTNLCIAMKLADSDREKIVLCNERCFVCIFENGCVWNEGTKYKQVFHIRPCTHVLGAFGNVLAQKGEGGGIVKITFLIALYLERKNPVV